MLQPKVKTVRPMENYTLYIEYENGEKRLFDVKPYIGGEWFGRLINPEEFNTVRPCGSTVEWAGGQDIAPHELFEMSTRLL